MRCLRLILWIRWSLLLLQMRRSLPHLGRLRLIRLGRGVHDAVKPRLRSRLRLLRLPLQWRLRYCVRQAGASGLQHVLRLPLRARDDDTLRISNR